MSTNIFAFGDDLAFVRGEAIPDRYWNGFPYLRVSLEDFDHLLTQLGQAAATDEELNDTVADLTEIFRDAQHQGEPDIVLGGGWIVTPHEHFVCLCSAGCTHCRWTGIAHDTDGPIPNTDDNRINAYLFAQDIPSSCKDCGLVWPASDTCTAGTDHRWR